MQQAEKNLGGRERGWWPGSAEWGAGFTGEAVRDDGGGQLDVAPVCTAGSSQ